MLKKRSNFASEKLIFFKNKISVLEVELQQKIKSTEQNLRQPKLPASYKVKVAAIFQSVNVTLFT